MIVLMVTAAILALVVGCGGGSDSTTSGQSSSTETTQGSATTEGDQGQGATTEAASGTSSKQAFIAEANAACEKAGEHLIEEINEYAERTGKKGVQRGKSLAEAVKATFLPVVEAEIAAIRELQVPPGDEETVEVALAAHEAVVEQLTKAESLKSFAEVENLFDKADKKLNSYGLTECSR
jgi:hypothetical protein